MSSAIVSAQLPPRAPWLGDLFSSVCLTCSKEFGVFNRRHHCRACGGLYCDKCSSHRVKGVPGYEATKEERVCDICYYNDIAIIVVWNLFLSGWQFKFFGDYEAAMKGYENIASYASRVIMKVGTGGLYASYFKNDQWKQRVMDYAYTQVRRVLRPRIPLLWHDSLRPATYEGARIGSIPASLLQAQFQYPPAADPLGAPYYSSVPPSMMPSQYQQQQQPQVPNINIPPQQAPSSTGVNPVQQPPVATAPPSHRESPRAPAIGEVQCGALVVYRQTDGESTDHTWIFFPHASSVEVMEEAGRFLRSIPRLSYGGVLDIHGTIQHFQTAPGTQGASNAYTQLFKTYLENMSIMFASRPDVSDSSVVPATSFYTKLRPALDAVQASQDPSVLLDMAGNVVMSRRCAPSTLDVLAKAAGAQLLKQQNFSVVLACGANIAANVFEDMHTARLHMVRTAGLVLFAVPKPDGVAPVPVLLQRHIFMTKEEALKLSGFAITKMNSLIGRQRIVVVPDTDRAASSSALARAPECGICFLNYDVDEHKPCLCSKCGNSLCYTCIRSVSLCPFCRKEMPVSGPWLTNVQLLQLLSCASDD